MSDENHNLFYFYYYMINTILCLLKSKRFLFVLSYWIWHFSSFFVFPLGFNIYLRLSALSFFKFLHWWSVRLSWGECCVNKKSVQNITLFCEIFYALFFHLTIWGRNFLYIVDGFHYIFWFVWTGNTSIIQHVVIERPFINKYLIYKSKLNFGISFVSFDFQVSSHRFWLL